MLLTIEEKQILQEFFQKHNLFTSGRQWPYFVDALLIILGDDGLEWGVRNDFEVYQVLNALIKRDESLRVLLSELSAQRQRQCLVCQNSENDKLKKLLAIKLGSANIKLKKMFDRTLC